jgi:hypothetical protein
MDEQGLDKAKVAGSNPVMPTNSIMNARQLIKHGHAVKIRKGRIIFCRYAGKRAGDFAEFYFPSMKETEGAARLLLTDLKAVQDDDDAYNAILDGRVEIVDIIENG